MYFISRYLSLFVCLFVLLFSINVKSAMILKVKNKTALIHLEGLKTTRGAYFEAIDLYGNTRGILKIRKTGQKKALGLLKWGHIGKRWSLEPTSKRKAIAKIKKKNRKQRLARIPKNKIKRKQAKARKRVKRGMASEQGEYIINDLEEETAETDDFSNLPYNNGYVGNSSNQTQEDFNSEEDGNEVKQFLIGFAPRIEYNWMKINPSVKDSDYLMTGLSYGGLIFADFSLNSFIRTEGSLGFKNYNASSDSENCKDRVCSLSINYISLALNLKLNVLEFDTHKFWLAVEGTLMHPISISNQANFTDKSFSPFHGTMGLAFGTDLTFGDIVIPISVKGGLYIPPTATTTVANIGVQFGLAYKL